MSATGSPAKGFRDVNIQSERQRDAETKHLQRSLLAKKRALGKTWMESQENRHQSTSPVRRKPPNDSRDSRTKSEPRSPRSSPHILPSFSNHGLIEKYLVDCARTMNKKDFNEQEWKLANQIHANVHHKRPMLKTDKSTPKKIPSQPGSRMTTPVRSSATVTSSPPLPISDLSQQEFEVPLSIGDNEAELTMKLSVPLHRNLTPPPIPRTVTGCGEMVETRPPHKSRGLTPPRYIRSTAEQMSIVTRTEEGEVADMEAKLIEEEAVRKQHVEVEVRKAEEEANRKVRAEEEAEKAEEKATSRKLHAEEEVARVEADAAHRKRRIEEEIKRAEEEATLRTEEAHRVAMQAKEEAVRRKTTGEAAARKAEKETAAKQLKAEVEAKRAEEEAVARRLQAQIEVRCIDEEVSVRILQAQRSAIKVEEDAADRELRAEAGAKRTEEEAAARKRIAEQHIRMAEEEAISRKLHVEEEVARVEEDAAHRKHRIEEEIRMAEEEVKRVEEDAAHRKHIIEEEIRMAEEEVARVEEDAAHRKHRVEEEIRRAEEEGVLRRGRVQAEVMKEEEGAALRKREAEISATRAEAELVEREMKAKEASRVLEERSREKEVEQKEAADLKRKEEGAVGLAEEILLERERRSGEEEAARRLLVEHEVNLEEGIDSPPSPPHPQRTSDNADLVHATEVLASKQIKKFIRKKRSKVATTHQSPVKPLKTKLLSPTTPSTDKEGDSDGSWTMISSGRSRSRARRPREQCAPPRDSSHSSQSLSGFEQELDTSLSPIRSQEAPASPSLLQKQLEEFARIEAVNQWSQSSACSDDHSDHSSQVSSTRTRKEHFLGRWGYWLFLVFTAASLTLGSAFIGLSHLRDPRTRAARPRNLHPSSSEPSPIDSSPIDSSPVLPEFVAPRKKGLWGPTSSLEPLESKKVGKGVLGQVRSALSSIQQHPLVANSDITREIVGVSMNSKVLKQLRRPVRVGFRYMGRSLFLTRKWVAFLLRPLLKARLLPLPILVAFMFMAAL